MIPGSGYRRSKTGRMGEVALWSAAGLVVFAAHAYAVALLLKEPEMVAADDAAPAAIMIELAAEPEAVVTEEEQIVPDIVESEEVESAAIEPLPQPMMELPPEPPVIPPPEIAEPVVEPEPEPITESVPEPMPEPLMELPPEPPVIPPPEIAAPIEEIDPIEEQVTAALENVEVPLPVMRPPPPPPEPEKVPEKKVEKKKPEKKVARKPPPPAQKAAREAKADVTQSNRTAAAQTSSGKGSSMTPARWQARLQSHLERRKKYPSDAQRDKEEGTPLIRFSIDDSGNVLSASVARSSGFARLDQAALDAARRASPVPAPPPGANKTITAPFRFKL